MEYKISISFYVWLKLIRDLRMRGVNERESGAFLLAKKGSARVYKYVCFDDLDPNCLTGIIEFDHSGYHKLSKLLKDENLVVIGDIHTHPGASVRQSEYDRTNPMISFPRHIALIMPFFAQNYMVKKAAIGIYEYQGNYSWKTLNSKALKITIL